MTIQQLLIIIGLLTIAGCITLWIYGLCTEGKTDMRFKDDASLEREIDDINEAEKKYDAWCERQIAQVKKRHEEETDNDTI